MEMGAGFSEHSVPVFLLQDAGLSHQEKSLMLASGKEGLESVDMAANLQRFFGSCGRAVRQDVLVTEDADGSLGGERDQEARAT